MLVLNTTSPPVNPSAPAEAPLKVVPSSRARTASIYCGSNDAATRFLYPPATTRNDAVQRSMLAHLETNRVRAGAHRRDGNWRRADAFAVDEHGGAAWTRFEEHIGGLLRRGSGGARVAAAGTGCAGEIQRQRRGWPIRGNRNAALHRTVAIPHHTNRMRATPEVRDRQRRLADVAAVDSDPAPSGVVRTVIQQVRRDGSGFRRFGHCAFGSLRWCSRGRRRCGCRRL